MSIFDEPGAKHLSEAGRSARQKIDGCFSTLEELHHFVTECGGDASDQKEVRDVAERLCFLDVASVIDCYRDHRAHLVACIRHERSKRRYVSAWADHFMQLTTLSVDQIRDAIKLYPTAVSNWYTIEMTIAIYRQNIPFEYASALPWHEAYQTPRGYRPGEMASLHHAGVPAEYASAVAASFASVSDIIVMYQSGIAAEYVIG